MAMEAWLANFDAYAPAVVFAAGFFDTLFLTGYFLFGFALMGSVAMLYATGTITVYEILIAAYLGTFSGSLTNFFIGYYFGERVWVQRALTHQRAKKVHEVIVRQHLFVAMFIGRFLGLTRPLYALALGALRVNPTRFAHYELSIAFIWASMWTGVLLFGKEIATFIL
jgi:membrane protein DedA with SNARE-associated domain